MASESFFILALIHFNLASTIDHQGVPALCSITSNTIFAGRRREGERQRQNQGLRSLSKTWDRPSRPGRLEREPESVDHSDRPPTTCQRDRQRQRSAAQAGGGRLSDWSGCCGEAEKGGKPSSGEIGRLVCTKQISQVAQSVPHLTALLPYLEVSSDQPYLLSRVRLLAKTGALSLFRWNGGGDGWTDRLPSDAELLVHCLACYFDARLLTSASMRLSGTTNPQAEVIISWPPKVVKYILILPGDETFHWCPLLPPWRETC